MADAVGTSPSRLVVGAVIGVLVAAAVAWSLVAAPSAGPRDAAAALPRATGSSPQPATTTTGAARLLVYITGAVVSPGVYRLPPDARVADAVDAAGGPQPDADLVLVNLAAVVSDGERVYVPRKGEVPPPGVLDAPGSGPGRGSGAGGAAAAPLNLNTATAEQLDALPGVGPATAQAIVSWRQQHGRFKRVDDLLNVRGIGPAKLDALRSQVRV